MEPFGISLSVKLRLVLAELEIVGSETDPENKSRMQRRSYLGERLHAIAGGTAVIVGAVAANAKVDGLGAERSLGS